MKSLPSGPVMSFGLRFGVVLVLVSPLLLAQYLLARGGWR